MIHSTASASNLPPPGVRLDPVAYGPYLGKIQLSAPYSPGGNLMNLSRISAYYYFENIVFQTLPNAPSGESDPFPYNQLVTTGSQTDHIVFDQCWFHPAPPPDRMVAMMYLEGTNLAVINSYADNAVLWAAVRTPSTATTSTSSTLTIPAHTYSFPVSGNTYSACTLASPATLTFTGSSTPVYVYWTFPACVLTANIQTGSSATGSAFSIVTTASPAFPLSASAAPDGIHDKISLEIAYGTGGGGSVSVADASQLGLGTGCCVNPNRFSTEWNAGYQLGLNSPGPTIITNNRLGGQEIVVFKDEWLNNTILSNTNNLTLQRNTIVQEPYLQPYQANYSGSAWVGRNMVEFKFGRYTLVDGNIVGPGNGGVAPGDCILFENFFANQNAGAPSTVNIQDGSDTEVSNNTCINTPGDFEVSGDSSLVAINPTNTRRRTWVHNNLFNQTNGYSFAPDPTARNPDGRGAFISLVESTIFDHNTYYETGGASATGGPSWQFHLSGGNLIANNIFNYNADQAYTPFLIYGNSESSTMDPANNTLGSALLAYLNETTWANNVSLCQWSNSNPASYAEISSATCVTDASAYPGTVFWPTGSTLANRVAAIHWYVPGTDFHLNYQSPYISGGSNRGSDGKDIGVDYNALNAAQGAVQNVHMAGSTLVWFAAPNDSAGCSVDYATTNGFITGSAARSTATTVSATVGALGAYGSVQTATLSGHGYYRINCQVMQPTGTF